jgi:hypothetical protein
VSASLAIAGVTIMLMDRLNDGLLNNNFNGPVDVSAKPPDKAVSGNNNSNESAQLNIFLYLVTPNIGWRNTDLPSRSSIGQRLTNPPLALDLHYLISAYGDKDVETDLLLGSAVQLLHEMPVISREEIRISLTEADLPNHLKGIGLSDTGLADQMELIKITPEFLNTEEMSKLWSAIQSNYRPSVAYMVTVVLIQEEKPTRSPLPVLKRGSNDSGPIVLPSLVPPTPAICSIEYPNQQNSARLNSTITIQGYHLDGNDVEVVFTPGNVADLSQTIALALVEVTATELTVQIPNDSVNWPAGLYTVEVRLDIPGETYTRITNNLPFVLAPTLTLPPVSITRAASQVTVVIDCSPEVRPNQTANLIIGQEKAIAEAHTTTVGQLSFIFGDITADTYPVRLRIDGAESWLIDMSVIPPVFDPSQTIAVPA